jgi:hypothetical protein
MLGRRKYCMNTIVMMAMMLLICTRRDRRVRQAEHEVS